MSLARAFTTRRNKRMEISSPAVSDMPALPGQIPSTPIVVRAVTVRQKNAPPIDMSKISAPVELISTTNMLSYNAPDISSYRKAKIHTPPTPPDSADSRSSTDESDARSTGSSQRSRETLTDASSIENSPISTSHPDNASSYFGKNTSSNSAIRRSRSTANLPHRKSLSVDLPPTPQVPQRAPSHSKRAHQHVARQRSMGHISNSSRPSSSVSGRSSSNGRPPSNGRLPREERSSLDFFKTAVDPTHPFNKELEQVNELAEEITTTVRDVVMDEDQLRMLEKGLAKFSANDYIFEIQPLFNGRFGQPALDPETTWI